MGFLPYNRCRLRPTGDAIRPPYPHTHASVRVAVATRFLGEEEVSSQPDIEEAPARYLRSSLASIALPRPLSENAHNAHYSCMVRIFTWKNSLGEETRQYGVEIGTKIAFLRMGR